MINKKNKKRKYKEFVDKNMYLIVPVLTMIIYHLILKDLLNISSKEEFDPNIVTITTTLIGTLFTVFSIFLALPNTNFIELMKKYGQYQKMNNILFVGIITSFISLILTLTDILPLIKEYLFVVSLVQTIYGAINLYRIAKINVKSNEK